MTKKSRAYIYYQNLCISSFYCINVTKIAPKFIVKKRTVNFFERIYTYIKSFHSCKTFATRFTLPKRNIERVPGYLFAYLYGV